MLLRLEVAGARKPEIDCALLSRELGAFAVKFAPDGCRELSAALSFVTPASIRELNAKYRGVDQETDVLSFPLWETDGAFNPPLGWEILPLGDIVVSPEYVFNSAEERKIDYNNETVLVIIHGALHLLGFDHDSDEREREMWRIQDALLGGYLVKFRHASVTNKED
ncbi:MAG: rRNA maturation RNase YbeY [Synergistaceae bacterium]|jgi:probable rRNA maturation factor|nr:rRNA maturation RNase YbeY [Synergistaceae bacterium]